MIGCRDAICSQSSFIAFVGSGCRCDLSISRLQLAAPRRRPPLRPPRHGGAHPALSGRGDSRASAPDCKLSQRSKVFDSAFRPRIREPPQVSKLPRSGGPQCFWLGRSRPLPAELAIVLTSLARNKQNVVCKDIDAFFEHLEDLSDAGIPKIRHLPLDIQERAFSDKCPNVSRSENTFLFLCSGCF